MADDLTVDYDGMAQGASGVRSAGDKLNGLGQLLENRNRWGRPRVTGAADEFAGRWELALASVSTALVACADDLTLAARTFQEADEKICMDVRGLDGAP